MTFSRGDNIVLALKQIIFAWALIGAALLSVVVAQDTSATNQAASLTVTAAAVGDRVRITALSSAVQMHVEVYGAGGEKLFDQQINGGNVFDWHLQDEQVQRLAPGSYLCVVTVKSVSGKLTQRIGTVILAENSVSVQPADWNQLTAPQTQAIGPVEGISSWTIARANEPQTPTVIAHDGTDGQMIRGRGALSFRLGNFFNGNDIEQMRLTEEGNLGIGTSQPQSKLDVAGVIRAERFLVVKPGTTVGKAQTNDTAQTTDSAGSVQPLVSGTGTQNQIAKWTDNAGTLGNSVISETAGGNVGIGTANPLTKLQVVGGSLSIDADQPIRKAGDNAIVGYASALPGITIGSGSPGDKVIFNAGGGERLRIDSNGNVGIGTANPLTKLQVVGGSLSIDADQPIRKAGDNAILGYASALPGITIGSGSLGDKVVFNAGGSERLRVESNGNVGIGTTNPQFKLDVAGRMRVKQQTNSATNTAGIWFNQIGPGNDQAFVGMEDDTHVGLFGNTGAGWGFIMDTTSGGVVANGDLHVNGGLSGGSFSGNSLASNTGISTDGANLNNGTITPGLTFGGGGSGEGISSKRTSGGNQFGLDFYTNFTNRMSITNGGNICIGPCFPINGTVNVATATTGFIGVPVAVYASGDTTNGFGIYGSGGFGTNSVGVRGESYRGVGVVAQTVIGNLVEGINGSSRVFHIDYNGTYTAGSDFAEALPASGNRAGYEPGDVLVLSIKTPGKIEKSSRPYDPRVAGIYSTRPGMLGADKNGTERVDPDDVPVAIVGIVPAKVSAMNGPIQAGDLLTTSTIPGYAMKASPVLVRGVKVYRTGTILGKALEPLKQGHGLIKVLVTLR
jgi:hypothetical protein